VSFLTHGLEFNKAAVFGLGKDNPETQDDQLEQANITKEVEHEIKEFLETKEYESENEQCDDY